MAEEVSVETRLVTAAGPSRNRTGVPCCVGPGDICRADHQRTVNQTNGAESNTGPWGCKAVLATSCGGSRIQPVGPLAAEWWLSAAFELATRYVPSAKPITEINTAKMTDHRMTVRFV